MGGELQLPARGQDFARFLHLAQKTARRELRNSRLIEMDAASMGARRARSQRQAAAKALARQR